MRLLQRVDRKQVARCWILHEKKSRKGKINKGALVALTKRKYERSLFVHRGAYPKSIFAEIKEWRRAKLTLADIRKLEHVSCELDNLSDGTLKIAVAAKNIIKHPELAKKKNNPQSWWHVKDILDRLEALALDETPVIIGKDKRSKNVRIYDGYHRLVATLIYAKLNRRKKIKEKEGYFGSIIKSNK